MAAIALQGLPELSGTRKSNSARLAFLAFLAFSVLQNQFG